VGRPAGGDRGGSTSCLPLPAGVLAAVVPADLPRELAEESARSRSCWRQGTGRGWPTAALPRLAALDRGRQAIRHSRGESGFPHPAGQLILDHSESCRPRLGRAGTAREQEWVRQRWSPCGEFQLVSRCALVRDAAGADRGLSWTAAPRSNGASTGPARCMRRSTAHSLGEATESPTRNKMTKNRTTPTPACAASSAIAGADGPDGRGRVAHRDK